jgi:hypothetical protein
MLKLLLVTLGTWSIVSLLLVATLGSLIHLREQRTCAMVGGTAAKLQGAGDRVARIDRAHAVEMIRQSGKSPEPRAARTAS